MNSVIRTSGKALSLYRNWYRGRRNNSTLDAKTYYEYLCDAVVQEYKTQGFCSLVDGIIEKQCGIEVISYHSLKKAIRVLQGDNKTDNIKYAPVTITNLAYFFSKPGVCTWDELMSYLQQIGTVMEYRYDERVNKMLTKLKTKGQLCHLKVLNNNQKDENKEMLEINAINEATINTDQILVKAREESSKIIEEARIEAERIRAEVYQDATKNNQGGETSILSVETIQKYLTKERGMIRISLDKEYENILDENRSILGNTERLHNEMCDQTNKLQASWVKALDKTVEELAAIKEDFYKRIHNWQVDLYPHELRPFAERYIELYSIVNVDGIIAEELFRINTGNNNDKSEHGTERNKSDRDRNVNAIDESQKEDIDQNLNTSPVLKELEKLNRKLCTFLTKFELSLRGLDMYVYHPENGEVYDEVWHVIEDDSDFDYSKEYRITRCVLPGVAKKVNDNGEDDVIIPAIVEV